MAEYQIFVNGTIFTSDDDNPWAQAMIVRDGRIFWVGQEESLPPCRGEVVDLKGKCVIPGFVDAHMHPLMLADFRKKIAVMPPEIRSIRDLQEAVRSRRKTQGPGRWIQGWGYDEQALAEKRSPNRYDLDQACSDAPVCLMRSCAHIRCVNSMALALAGIDKDTPNPPGGEIERDESGEPTGVLKETAGNLLAPFLPAEQPGQQIDNLLELGELLASQGITAVCDMGNLDSPDDSIPIYEEAARRGFRQKVGVYYMWSHFAGQGDAFPLLDGRMDRSRQIFAAGLKLIGDGSVSGRTAWMEEPYLGPSGGRDLSGGSGSSGSPDLSVGYGFPVCTDDQIESAIRFCKSHGCQLSMHAMGTRAIARMVDRACRETPWTEGPVPYVRIEHVTAPSEESIRRAADHGIAFVTQPIFLYAESASYLAGLGPERIKTCYPVKKILESGVALCFSSDAPATFWAVPSDPLPGLKLAVTRRAADGTDCGSCQALDMETAVKLYTRESAKAAGFSGLGMLKEGYRADFAVLSESIFSVSPEQADEIRVLQTYMDGICVYNAIEK